jgi:carboxymethylenebutenolidase
MGKMIQIKSAAADGFEFGALHVDPVGRRRGGVIVLQEIFGIDQYVVADAERWSRLGFEVVAPSMFDRQERGFVAEHGPEGFTRGREVLSKAKPEDAIGDIAACVAFLAPRGPVFLVGYCYGGSSGWLAAGQVEGLAAVSCYYGSMISKSLQVAPKCSVICHFGRKDAHIPADETKAAIESAYPQVPVYIYDNSGHGFNNEGGPGYDSTDAELARRRTLTLFEEHGAQ